jgi:hypothetical protein
MLGEAADCAPLSGAAMLLMENADKIQTQMLRWPRQTRSHGSARDEARAGPENLPPISELFRPLACAMRTQWTGQFVPRPANSAAVLQASGNAESLEIRA